MTDEKLDEHIALFLTGGDYDFNLMLEKGRSMTDDDYDEHSVLSAALREVLKDTSGPLAVAILATTLAETIVLVSTRGDEGFDPVLIATGVGTAILTLTETVEILRERLAPDVSDDATDAEAAA